MKNGASKEKAESQAKPALHSNQRHYQRPLNQALTPPLWTDLVKILTSKPAHSSSFLLECTDFKNVIFENIPLPLSQVAEVNLEIQNNENSK